MTIRRNRHRESISNYFDEVLEGIGKRGSSFMDIDAVSHDKDSHRFLFQEFKEPGEAIDPAQAMALRDLAALPGCEVWFVRRLDNGMFGWARFGDYQPELTITRAEYQARVRRWWRQERIIPPMVVDTLGLTAERIDWGEGIGRS